MIIERNLAPYVIFSEDPLLRALAKINDNKARIIFCVSEHGVLEGSLSDGDFRRWVATQAEVDLDVACGTVANRSPRVASAGADLAELATMFDGHLDHIPLVDERGRLTALAIDRAGELRIGGRVVGADAPAFVIAEIGINHNGSVELAKRLVDEAAAAGADCAKFQMRDLASLYRNQGAADGAGEDLGPQYTLDLLAKFSLEAEQLFEVFDHCASVGLAVMCTPWDPVSVDRLDAYGVAALKIASADLTNHGLLVRAARTGRPMILSTGMSVEAEIVETVGVLRGERAAFALLQCNSTYPAPFKDVNLAYMDRLAQIGQCPVGYSGHERGFHVPIAAVARGAKIIEKHFTVDRSMEGNDHKVSLLPDEFASMVSAIREVEEALGSAASREITPGEMMNRVNLAKSLVAARAISAGEVITADAVAVKSPGRGLQPNAFDKLVGNVARRDLATGDFFFASDAGDVVVEARDYHFRRPWGLPVRFHDFPALADQSNPDFLEFHLTYKDMELALDEVFDAPLPYGLTVHSPDLFPGDFILNLAADDDATFDRSVGELQRVIDLTRRLKRWFPAAVDPVVIASLGGFTKNAHVDADARKVMYERVASGLDRLDTDGVTLCPQTLPPFPWYLGGQLFCNLFVHGDDTAWFAEKYGWPLTFDISHSKLAANFTGVPFSTMVDLLAPHTRHLHIVDAVGVDGEGVQVGDGEVDFAALAAQVDRWCPDAGFIPEIWQGHVNDGEGFWVALERLEAWF